MLEDALERCLTLDWRDMGSVIDVTSAALTAIATDRKLLRAAVQGCVENDRLFSMCEHYDILEKLVLFHDPDTDLRLRLHLFLPGYYDRPHNHRWPYTSYIIKGRYKHYLYSSVTAGDEVVNTTDLRVEFAEVRQEGTCYSLQEHLFHSIVAEPYTVSLIVRGPASAKRFVVMDRRSGEAWWQYAANYESDKEILQKRMSSHQYEGVKRKLTELEVI